VAAVLVHIDLDGDHAHPSSLAALAAGRLVASSWGATLYAAVIARDTVDGRSPDSTTHALTTSQVPGFEKLQPQLARAGADKIVVALSDVPVSPLWASVGVAWQGVLDHLRPRLVLFGADAPSAAEVAPRTGAKIGARLLVRGRPLGLEDVELRDRDGGYVRAQDSGAAVVLVGAAPDQPDGDDDIDVIVLALPGGGDDRVEVAATQPLASADSCGALIVVGDDVAADAAVLADIAALAGALDAKVVGSRAAAASVTGADALERGSALAPELCVQVGATNLDVAGATTLVRVGAGGKMVDAAVPGPTAEIIGELVGKLAPPRGRP
jgi:electron transfer flavoprotein alpha subunit